MMKKAILTTATVITLVIISNIANAQIATAIKFGKYAWNTFSTYTNVDYAVEGISSKTIKEHLRNAYYRFTKPNNKDAEEYGKGYAKGLGDAIRGSGICPSKSKAFKRGYEDGYSLGSG